VIPPQIYQECKYDDQHSDDDEGGHGYSQYSRETAITTNNTTAMNMYTRVIGIERSIIVAQIPGSTQQSPSGPRVPAV
jgi:hypothetical protein